MKTRIYIIIVGLFFITFGTCAQSKGPYTSSFLRAKFLNPEHKKLIAIFHIYATDTADFPPKLIFHPECRIFVNGEEKVISLDKKEIHVSLNDDYVFVKDPFVYELVKDRVDLHTKYKILIMSFYFENITEEYFDTMSLDFTLGEKRRPEKTFTNQFKFQIEDYSE